MAEAALKKLDGQLRRLIREWHTNREISALADRGNAGVDEQAAPEQLTVHITFRGDPQAIRDAGFDVQGEAGTTASVILTPDRLEALAAVDGVITVHAPPRVGPLLDRSVPEIRADAAWSVVRPAVAGPSRGQGVVIGIVDSGIDVAHPAFRRADGTTRILFLWDQVLDDPVRRPAGFARGIEFDSVTINQQLAAHPDGIGLPSSLLDGDAADRSGHGTHVAGIAAGNGSGADRCGRELQYVGVAAEADLIIVKIGFGKDVAGVQKHQDYLEAVRYIFLRAAARPCVVNLSLGGHWGPHNGAGWDDAFLRARVTGRSGRAIVASAGNEREHDTHAFTAVAPLGGAAEVVRLTVARIPMDPLGIFVNHIDRFSIFISHDGNATIECRVSLPERPGRLRSTAFIAPDSAPPSTVIDDHTIVIDDDPSEPGDGDLHFHISVSRNTPGQEIERGTWSVELRNTRAGGAPVTDVHLWIVGDKAVERAVRFRPNPGVITSAQDIDRRRKRPDSWIASTIKVPGTADDVITVGAYNAENRNALYALSSQGPTVDGRAKPDISAPGVGIDSAKGNARRCWLACECCVDRYWPMEGTSMAAPHVTGVVALMLAQNPNLSSAELKQILQDSARTPPPLPSGWAPSAHLYGAGLIDAHYAVFVANRQAGGSAPEPPPPSTFVALAPRPAFERDWRARVRSWNERFGAQPAWQLFSALVSEHFDEVERLVNGNKRVGAIWRRNGGPALVRHLMDLPTETEVPIPRTLEGCEPERLLRSLLGQLERFGSAALRLDARRYGAFAAALPGARLADLDRLLADAAAA
jgi:subtilisin family serine protease